MNYSPRFAGAVSLDSLARRPTASAPAGTAPSEAAAAPGLVIDVTEASFQADVIERSMNVPVVIDFWADWCGPCKQLSPILEQLAGEGAGTWVLAKIDVDANPRLAQAAAVQGIPAVKAVWQGGIVGEFTGAMPMAQVRDWIDQLVAATGGQVAAAGAEPPQPPVDPVQLAAAQAFEEGDYDAAEAAYQSILDKAPGDAMARGALAGVRLFRRAEGLDSVATRAAADAAPDDVALQAAAADVDVLEGLTGEAFARLVATVARTSGSDRDKARLHLLGLFDAVGPDDPTVVSARGALSRALF